MFDLINHQPALKPCQRTGVMAAFQSMVEFERWEILYVTDSVVKGDKADLLEILLEMNLISSLSLLIVPQKFRTDHEPF